MPTPSTPDASSGRSSSVRRASSVHTPASVPPDDDTDTYTHLPEPPADETPTIISSNQGRATAPDSQIAKSLTGRKLGHFELIEAVGVGGMAAVIRARDLDLGRDVALKILPPEMAVDPENITRFKQEARAAAKLDHDNIARAYYCGEDQGLHFIAFEFVEGENLRVLMDQRGPLPVSECIHYMLQVAAGLSHAAARGVVHRDIKPSNIVITPEGRAKIVDMGLARNLDPQTGIDGGVTQSGVTLGTFDYISPEQALEPRTADVRADIYSLGCTFYHVLTGQAPVPEGTAAKKLHHHQFLAPIDPRQLNPDIPDELTAILARMMAKDLRNRYQTPEHLVQHLLALAQKLNLASEATLIAENGRNGVLIDTPLPSPPRLSPFVIGLIAIAVILGMMFVSGTFNRIGADSIDPPPLWALDKTIPSTPVSDPSQIVGVIPNTDVISPVQIRQAATTAELVALLQQGASRIQLTGRMYDLTVPLHPGESLPVALFEGRELVLDAIHKNNPPIVRIAYGPLDDGQTARPGSLTFRTPSTATSANITIKGLRFEIVTPTAIIDDPMLPPHAAITVLGIDRFRVEECAFTTSIVNIPDGAAIALGKRAGMGTSSPIVTRNYFPIEFDSCYFGQVGVAVHVNGRSTPILAKNCAFAPHTAVFRFRSEGEAIETGTASVLRLDRCTALIDTGAVVEVASKVPVLIDAGHCLFCNLRQEIDEPLQPIIRDDLENRRRSVLIRQPGSITAKFQTMQADGSPLPNGYYRVAALDSDNQTMNFDECKSKNLSITDATAIDLKDAWPLKTKQPESLLAQAEKAQFAFQANEADTRLRVSNPDKSKGGESILGVFYVLGVSPYASPLGPLVVAPRPGPRQKVWQPDLPLSQEAPPGVYRDLSAALAEALPNEVVLVRFNNLRPISLIRLKDGSKVILRPDTGYRPILAIDRNSELTTAMFRPNGGSLTLENIDFYLAEDQKAPTNQRLNRSIVLCVGGGEVEFKNCRFQFMESAGADLSLVNLSQPDGEMMLTPAERMPTPRVSLTNCFVHGRGNLIDIHPSRSFILEMENSVVALDGTFASVESAPKEPAANAVGTINLTRVTTFLTGSFVHMQAPKREDSKIVGLVPLNVTATQCLFVPAGNQAAAFARFDRIDTEMQAKELLLWKNGRQNWYGYGSPQLAMLQVQPEEGGEMMMPAKALDSKRWLEFTREAGHACRVKFDISSDFNFQTLRPNDFRILTIEPMPSRIEGDNSISGVVLEKLLK